MLIIRQHNSAFYALIQKKIPRLPGGREYTVVNLLSDDYLLFFKETKTFINFTKY